MRRQKGENLIMR